MNSGWGSKFGLLVAGAVALSACEEAVTSPRPEPRAPVPAPDVVEAPVRPSERSIKLAAYYERLQQQLLTSGLLRKDGGGPDTPFSKRDLKTNFLKIAGFSEADIVNNTFVKGETATPIRRWTEPVRVQLDFGETASRELIAETRGTVGPYVKRLERLTGHPISQVSSDPNFIVAVLNVDELEAYDATLTRLFPALPPALARNMTTLTRIDNCVVYSFEDGEPPNQIDFAVAIIRAEHPKLLRDSCFHEEIAQGLGLSNDSPAARPSIFNDDDEFALLTRHDELLLQILYDKRLPLGATPDEARPVVEVIASELLGGDS